MIEPITEERASRTLYRIELLRKVREQVLHHPQLAERLKLCQPSLDLPEWWECGKHDKDLLIGAAKHGVSRTDYHILNDPELSFLDSHKNFAQSRGGSNLNTVSLLNSLGVCCSQTTSIVPSTPAQEEKSAEQAEVKLEGPEKTSAKEKSDSKEEEEATHVSVNDKEECEAEAEPGPVKCEIKEIELNTEVDPKSISEKGSEDDEEEKLDDDDKSEESSQPEGNVKKVGIDDLAARPVKLFH